MESLSYHFNLKKPKIYTPDQDLADQIFSYFQKRISFSRIMKIIKSKGRHAIYEIWNEIKHSNARDHLSLFLWKVKQEKILWQ